MREVGRIRDSYANPRRSHLCFKRCGLLCSHLNSDLFTCEDISCFRVKAHLVFHWCLFNTRFSYHFIKMWNSDELPEQIYQPLGTQNDCATVLDNYPHVMIKIHHGGELFLVINKALIFGIGLKFRYI